MAPFANMLANACGQPYLFSLEAEAEARLCFLDTLGCIYAGWHTSQAKKTRTAFKNDSAASIDALIFGVAAHALDFDDYEISGSTHPSAVICASLLAGAMQQKTTIGQLLKSYIAGYEVLSRTGLAMGYQHYIAGWHATSTTGIIGGAAAMAYLNGADEHKIAHSLAIAASLASGLKSQFGSEAKAMHAGFAARAAIEAARLGTNGLEAVLEIFEKQGGFFNLFSGQALIEEALTEPKPQQAMLLHSPVFRKPWPSCSYTHRLIASALKLAPEVHTRLDQIQAIILKIPEPYFQVASFTHPKTESEARFSLSYCVATCLIDNQLSAKSFDKRAIAREDIKSLLAKTQTLAYPVGDDFKDMHPDFPDWLIITLKDGRQFEAVLAHPPGSEYAPMTQKECLEKFIACGGDTGMAELILDAPSSQKITVTPTPEGPKISADTAD